MGARAERSYPIGGLDCLGGHRQWFRPRHQGATPFSDRSAAKRITALLERMWRNASRIRAIASAHWPRFLACGLLNFEIMKIKTLTTSTITLFKESTAKWSEDNAM